MVFEGSDFFEVFADTSNISEDLEEIRDLKDQKPAPKLNLHNIKFDGSNNPDDLIEQVVIEKTLQKA